MKKTFAQAATTKLEEKQFDHSNDTQAKEKSQCTDPKSCCNYDGGNCIRTGRWPALYLCTEHLLFALLHLVSGLVLPGDPALYAEISKPRGLKRCAECGTLFLTKSNRAKYCSDCARKVHRRQKTANDRKRRSRTEQIGHSQAGYILGFETGNYGGES